MNSYKKIAARVKESKTLKWEPKEEKE